MAVPPELEKSDPPSRGFPEERDLSISANV